MSTEEKCRKCDGTPLRTGKCNPVTCTVGFVGFSMGDYACEVCGSSYGHMTKPKGKCPMCGK